MGWLKEELKGNKMMFTDLSLPLHRVRFFLNTHTNPTLPLTKQNFMNENKRLKNDFRLGFWTKKKFIVREIEITGHLDSHDLFT